MRGLNGPRRLVAAAPDGWALKAVRVGGIDVADAVLPFGRADDSLRDVEIVMTSRVTEVRVTAVDRAGAPSAAVVALLSTDRARWYPGSRYMVLRPARAGAATLRGIMPGDYYVVALDPAAMGPLPANRTMEDMLASFTSGATRVTVGEGQTVTVTVTVGGK
jgi:hypothetical protein